MSTDPRLLRLRSLSALVLQAQTVKLREAAAARAHLREQLRGLDRATPEAADDLAVAHAAYRYEVWAATRRSEINQSLAQRHAEWLTELTAARQTFGRDQVIKKLTERSPKG